MQPSVLWFSQSMFSKNTYYKHAIKKYNLVVPPCHSDYIHIYELPPMITTIDELELDMPWAYFTPDIDCTVRMIGKLSLADGSWSTACWHSCSKKRVGVMESIPGTGGAGYDIPDDMVGTSDYCEKNTLYAWSMNSLLGEDLRGK